MSTKQSKLTSVTLMLALSAPLVAAVCKGGFDCPHPCNCLPLLSSLSEIKANTPENPTTGESSSKPRELDHQANVASALKREQSRPLLTSPLSQATAPSTSRIVISTKSVVIGYQWLVSTGKDKSYTVTYKTQNGQNVDQVLDPELDKKTIDNYIWLLERHRTHLNDPKQVDGRSQSRREEFKIQLLTQINNLEIVLTTVLVKNRGDLEKTRLSTNEQNKKAAEKAAKEGMSPKRIILNTCTWYRSLCEQIKTLETSLADHLESVGLSRFTPLPCVASRRRLTDEHDESSPGARALARHRLAHPYKDSPVLMRLLREIVEAQERA